MPTLASKRPSVPFLDLALHHRPFAASFRKKLDELVRSSQFILGGELEAFEREFATYLGVRHAVGVSNGTDALRLACEAIGINPGDEVIVPAYTFIATALGVTFAGGIPRFVDVSPDTFNLDPAQIERAITPKTRAILPVHLFGHPADMPEILALAKTHRLRVFEDAAQAHGAAIGGRKVGGWGDLGCFSFYPTKNLSALGDGGAVVTNDDGLADRLRVLRNLGQKERYVHSVLGHNNRLDNLQAAFLRIKLKRLESFNRKRRAAAAAYGRRLPFLGATLPSSRPGCDHAYHLYSLLHPERDALRTRLQAAGIGCGIYYSTPAAYQECYRELGYRPGAFPVAERLCRENLALPIFPEITALQIRTVARALEG
jgi:dTDP-4-amino-4,6-dideoxygalactose transaminase